MNADGVVRREARVETSLVVLLLITGVYLPSSMHGDISGLLNYLGYVVAFVILFLLNFNNGKRIDATAAILVAAVLLVLAVFTGLSGLESYTPGALVPYAVFGMLCCSNLSDFHIPRRGMRAYVVVNVVNGIVGLAILAGFEPVREFLVAFYSAFYPELVQNMLDWHKPVLTFGTHSLAAFYLYLFFYCNLRTYEIQQRRPFLLFAVLNLFFMFCLLSVSGILLGGIGVVQLLALVRRMSKKMFFLTLATMFLAVPMILGGVLGLGNWSGILELAKSIITEPNSGWLGRFGGGGYMQYDLWYLSHHPFAPVGVSFREELMFGDSGMFEYLLRGSLLLVVLVYSAYFLFVQRNVLAKADRRILFFMMLAFETGYSALMSVRMLSLLVFFVVYLNSLSNQSSPRSTVYRCPEGWGPSGVS